MLSGVLLFGLYIWALLHLWQPTSSGQKRSPSPAVVVGQPWSRLLHDYNVFAGRVWVVLLMLVTIAPFVLYRLQQ